MKTFIALFVFISSFSVTAQSISEQMGGVSCDFKIFSDTTELNVIKQLLIQRPNTNKKISTYESDGYAYAYAYSYTEWCLEFVTNTKITSRKWTTNEGRDKRGKYHIKLRDNTGAVLVSTYIGKDKVGLWTGKKYFGDLCTYSLNLVNLPLIILDEIEKIEIILID